MDTEKTSNTNKQYTAFYPSPVKRSTPLAGVKMDFNYGARVVVPAGNYHVRLTDIDTDSILYDADVSNAMITSTKKFFICSYKIKMFTSYNFPNSSKFIHIKFHLN